MPIGTSLAPYLPLVEGKRVGGEIVDFRVQQKKDYDTGRSLYFVTTADGKKTKGFESFTDGVPNEPICDWVFTVDTGEEDENGETERRIFLDPRKGARGSDVEGKRGRDAIEIALKKVKAHKIGLEIGGKIFITRGPQIAPKRGDAKCVTYTAEYEPPTAGVGTGTPVDEVPWLIGGERFAPGFRLPDNSTAPEFTPPPAEPSPEARRSAALGIRDTDVSPGAKVSAGKSYDDDPPF